MKKRIFKSVILCSLLLVIAYQSSAQQEGFTKKYHETYSTNANSHLYLDNKYGNITINDWENNQVEIDVTVLVENVSSDKAEKILSYINVVFSQEGDDIKATTTFDEHLGKIGDENHRQEINYTVNMPKDIKINLANKYGNVFITELAGETVIDIKYGKLKADKILRGNEKPLSEVNLAYSEASIEEASWLKSDLKYSILKISKSKALVLFSKYSKIFIDECSFVVSDSKYDAFEMGRLSNFVINAEYSNFKIKEIDKKLECTTSYTSGTIESIPAGFESIVIDSRYGTYKLGIDEAASYKLDGNAGYAKISYHETGEVSKISENTSMKVFGTVGKDSNTSSTVTVTTKYGGIILDY